MNETEKDVQVAVSVNGVTVTVPLWARWRDAVTAWSSEAAVALAHGEAVLRDPRGEPVDPDGRVVSGGAIAVLQCGE